VSQLQSVSLFVAFAPSCSSAGFSCNWFAWSCNWSVKLQLVRVELQLICQVAISSAAKLQPQILCICYTECTWVHFSIIYTCVCRVSVIRDGHKILYSIARPQTRPPHPPSRGVPRCRCFRLLGSHSSSQEPCNVIMHID
jgi:hypothetical protein